MAYCPNTSLKEWKDLVSAQGKKLAYFLWDKYKGNVPSMFYVNSKERVSTAKSWIGERFGDNALSIYESVEAIGDVDVHGYVENGLIYMWSAAEMGTEFHEGYHLAFRTMLSEDQRAGLYEETEKKFGKPTASEIAAIKNELPDISDDQAYKAVLEEKMAEEFREYMLAEGEVKSLPSRIAKFFKDLWNFLKAIMSDGLSLQQSYSLIASNKMNSTLLGRGVFRNSEKFKGNNRANLTRPGFGPEAITDAVDILYTKFLSVKKSYNNPKNPFSATRVLGEGQNKGSLANGLIVQIYENEDGSPLTNTTTSGRRLRPASTIVYWFAAIQLLRSGRSKSTSHASV